MDDETKRAVCRMVAGLVATDEDFNDAERVFVDKVLTQFGIPEEEWDAIFPLVEHDEAAAAISDLNDMSQKETFELLIEAAFADGHLADEERNYLVAVGRSIGLSESEVEQRLE